MEKNNKIQVISTQITGVVTEWVVEVVAGGITMSLIL